MTAKLVRIGIIFLMVISILSISHTPVLASTTSISAVPSVSSVSPGGTFDVMINVSSDVETRGMACELHWDATKVQCNSVSDGTFYQSFAQAHNASVSISPSDPPHYDNTAGKFPSGTDTADVIYTAGIAMIGGDYDNQSLGTLLGPTGTGSVFILHMAAEAGASGTVNFTLSNTKLNNNGDPPVNQNPSVVPGVITISNGSSNPLAVTSSTATSITSTVATLNGDLTSLGSDSSESVSFEYGTTTGYGSTTTAQTLTSAGVFSKTITGLTANTTYHFRAQAVGSSTVNGVDMTFTTSATGGALAVTSTAATNITPTGATLNGNLTSLGSDSSESVSFEYGTTTSYGSTTTAQTLTSPGVFSQAITGLTANTAYHFRAKAVGSSTVNGSDMTFATSATGGALAVTSAAATNITATGATLNGDLTSLGSDNGENVGFKYGTTTSYGNTTTTQTLTSPGVFSQAITGLTANTTYHFCAEAVGSSTVNGSDMTFITTASTSTTSTTTSSTTPATTTATTTQTATTVTTTTTPTTTSTAIQTATPTTTHTSVVTTTQLSSPVNILPKNSNATLLDVSDSIDTSGLMLNDFEQDNIRYSGNNQIDRLEISSGTRIVGSDGTPESGITVQPGSNVPAAPSGETIVSAVEFGPDGTLFSSPITVVFGYDPSQIPQNSKASNISLEYFDTQTNQWVNCDYSVDILNRQIDADISHFSLYAVMVSKNTGLLSSGWSLVGLIIIGELLLGGIFIYFLSWRKRPSAPAIAVAAETNSKIATAGVRDTQEISLKEHKHETEKATRFDWDDILPEAIKKGEPFKTHIEITGGKIVIPRDGKSADIELVNNPDSRILITLEYDSELHPRGLAKIMVLGHASEYEKTKEIEK